MLILPTLVAALVLPASAQIFRLPDADACEKSKTPDGMIFNSLSFQHLILATMYFEKVWLAGVIHAERFGKRYHFSWLEAGPNTKWDWEGARNYCRKFCMDSIAINSVAESKWVKNLIRWKISSVKSLSLSRSGLRSFITSGPEAASATSRVATGRTCSQQFRMDGNGFCFHQNLSTSIQATQASNTILWNNAFL